MSHKNVSSALEALQWAAKYYRYELDAVEVARWTDYIAKYGDEAVRNFIFQHVETGEFFPRLSVLAKALNGFAPGSPSLAMEEILRAAAKYGPYRSPEFSDPAIPFAIDAMGGWASFCEMLPNPTEDRFGYEALAKRFGIHYEMARALELRAALPRIELRPIGALNYSTPSESPALDLRASEKMSPR